MRPLACILLSSLLAPSVAGEVLVVDGNGGPGVDFTSLQAAVDAAAEGDTLLVYRGGDYATFAIDGKSLDLVASPETGRPKVVSFLGLGGVTVSGLGRGQRVTVTGFRIDCGIEVADCAGDVWLEDCLVSATQNIFDAFPDGLRVANSSSVTVVDCELTGTGVETGSGGNGGAGLLVGAGCAVAAFDSRLEGGRGSAICCCGVGADGGHGAQVAGLLVASGCTFRGGQGGDFDDCAPAWTSVPTDGGDGLHLDGAASRVVAVGASYVAGAPGHPTNAAEPGLPVAVGDGTWVEAPHAARSLTTSGPAYGGEDVTLTFSGEAGDFVFGIASPHPAFFEIPGWFGALSLEVPNLVLPVGFLPASGVSALGVGTTALDPGIESLQRFVQPLMVTPGLDYLLGAPAVLTVLDGSFQ